MQQELLTTKVENGVLTICPHGHINSANAGEIEEQITAMLGQTAYETVVVDAGDLEYISSAGLRVLLRLRKAVKDVSVIQVSPEVYEVFDMTGFTEMMDIRKAYREISLEGCEVIGQGANGTVYRTDPETIVKMYNNPDALPEIQRERELARTAFVLGVPTAISYDVVRVGNRYGSVFELLNATNLAKLYLRGEKSLDEITEISIDLLKVIHGTTVKAGLMPDMREVALGWIDFLKEYLEPELYEKIYGLIEAVPYSLKMMHGDYHLKNIMVQNGEALLIDMDTLCTGNPVFEFASMYAAYQGYSYLDHDNVKKFLGLSYEDAGELWRKSVMFYLGTEDEETIRKTEEKAMLIGFIRIMRRQIRRNGFDTEEGRAVIENAHQQLRDLASRVDTLII